MPIELDRLQNIRTTETKKIPGEFNIVTETQFPILVKSLADLIPDVQKNNGIYYITLDKEIVWEHDVSFNKDTSKEDLAGLELVFRAALQTAARIKAGEKIDHHELLKLQKEARYFTRHSNPDAKAHLVDIKASAVLSRDIEDIHSDLLAEKKGPWRFLAPSAATLSLLATSACLAAPSPSPIEAPAPEETPQSTLDSSSEITSENLTSAQSDEFFTSWREFNAGDVNFETVSQVDYADRENGDLVLVGKLNLDGTVDDSLQWTVGDVIVEDSEENQFTMPFLFAYDKTKGDGQAFGLLYDEVNSKQGNTVFNIVVEDEKEGIKPTNLILVLDSNNNLYVEDVNNPGVRTQLAPISDGNTGEPTPAPTQAPDSIVDTLKKALNNLINLTAQEEVQAAPPETEEAVVLPEGITNVTHLKEWDIGLDKDNLPVAILTKEGEAHWIPVPLDQLSQLPSWSQPKLVVSEDGTLRYVDANGKPLYALQGEKWIEEKELYYECGVGWFRIGIHKDIDPLGPDGEILPTGVYGTEFGFLGLKYFSATGCLLDEMTPVPEERFGVKNLYETKLGFWDSDGKLHGIPAIYGGGVANLGAKPTDQSLSLACFNNTCRAMPVEEAVEKLNTLYDSPNSNFQADFQIVLSQGENQQPDWSLRDYIIDNANLYLALKEAIKTGKNFPQLPEDFVVYLWQISMHE